MPTKVVRWVPPVSLFACSELRLMDYEIFTFSALSYDYCQQFSSEPKYKPAGWD